MTEKTPAGDRIAALAGRRIDAAGSLDAMFPLDHAFSVELQLRKRFADDGVGLLVCSAACGADLLALKAAADMGIERVIVLPFNAGRFLQTSVLDRPGDWKGLYEQQIEGARRRKTLIVLDGAEDDASAYSAATGRIIAEAAQRTGSAGGVAYVVWEGRPRSDHDETADFRKECERAGLELHYINTMAG
jgi:hypothetical protein